MKIQKINVGMASCGLAGGAKATYETLQGLVPPTIPVKKTGCVGSCAFEPIVDVVMEDGSIYRYQHITPKKAKEIVDQHVLAGEPIDDYRFKESDEILKNQVRIVMKNAGLIDPEDIDDYLAHDGYKGLERALGMTPEEVVEEVKQSGLRGRGGAGFPTGLKWSFAQKAKSDQKYVVVNADEGDPGAFMDRNILESDPHAVLEGVVIAAYAIGASKGYVYCRAEYPLAIERLKIAIDQAQERGFMGENILGSGFSFELKIKEGAGAFVCGEETALMASIEGKRGNPRPKPPFPANSGLWGRPTNINNVKTYANVPWIFRNGWEKFHAIGVEHAPGTALFSLTGKIRRPGMIEVEMGTPLRDIIFKVGGGILDGKKFKAVQTGGPSGGCLPASHLDSPVDYETMAAAGSIMGSGGMIVLDEDDCMVKLAHYFLTFTQQESCGKCVPCRIGTRALLVILDRIINGQGEERDFLLMETLAHTIKMGSLCGLGQTAPNPVMTTMKYFRNEYEAHIRDRICPSKDCKALIEYVVDPDKCIGCVLCSRNCALNAISGSKGSVHLIDQEVCVKCGVCYASCPQGAIFKRDPLPRLQMV